MTSQIKKSTLIFFSLIMFTSSFLWGEDKKSQEATMEKWIEEGKYNEDDLDEAIKRELYLSLKAGRLKKPKKHGTIKRVDGNMVEIDKGSLSRVHEYDVYKVYDPDGQYKGKVEIKAVGDLNAVGQVYGPTDKGERVKPFDKVVYQGHRKFFELGIRFGQSLTGESPGEVKDPFVETIPDSPYLGGGLVWRWNFQSGWAIEFLWSDYKKEDTDRQIGSNLSASSEFFSFEYDGKSDIFFPFGIRKNFNYPSVFSPFLGGGVGYFVGKYNYNRNVTNFTAGTNTSDRESVEKKGFVPYGGAGFQLFSGSTLHIDIEARYYHTPKVEGRFFKFDEKPVILSISATTGW